MSRLVGSPVVEALMDAVTAEVVKELPASAVVLKIFEAAAERTLTAVITGALERLVRRLELANLDITLAPGAVVRAEVVDRDKPKATHEEWITSVEPRRTHDDPGAAPDIVPVETLK